MRERDCAFLTYLQTDYAIASSTFKNQRTAYFSLRALTTRANEPQDLDRGYWIKVHEICSRSNFFHSRC